MGPATVGTLGWHGRLDYTAIGNVVNLASRLCDLAEDAQILVDPVVTGHVKDSTALTSIGERTIKGYDRALEVFAVVRSVGPLPHPGCQFQPADVRPVEAGLAASRRSFLRRMPAE
jgi:adenylate cyclase